jgi:hypothetical protein
MPAEPRMLTDAEYHQVVQWYLHDGMGQEEIARRLGIPKARLFDRGLEARKRGVLADSRLAHMDRRQGQNGGRRPGIAYRMSDGIVSEQEAEARRQAIFNGWDAAERESRRGAGYIEDRRLHRGRYAWANEPARGYVPTSSLGSQPRHRNW